METNSEKITIPIEPKILQPRTSKPLNRSPLAHQNLKQSSSSIISLLVCDDDIFQKFLISMALDRLRKLMPNAQINLYFFPYGEELLDYYSQKAEANGSQEIFIVITDYDMGKNHKTGIKIAEILRNKAFKGPIMIRSSEHKEYIKIYHPEFESYVNQFSSKSGYHLTLDLQNLIASGLSSK